MTNPKRIHFHTFPVIGTEKGWKYEMERRANLISVMENKYFNNELEKGEERGLRTQPIYGSLYLN